MHTNEYLRRLEDISRAGDELQGFMSGGAYEILKRHILDPMYLGAFEAFKRVDPSDSLQVLQTQQIGKVIVEIEKLIEGKIQEGRLAKISLAELPETEGE